MFTAWKRMSRRLHEGILLIVMALVMVAFDFISVMAWPEWDWPFMLLLILTLGCLAFLVPMVVQQYQTEFPPEDDFDED
jgi:predicted MFS family arabinose efflux permease